MNRYFTEEGTQTLNERNQTNKENVSCTNSTYKYPKRCKVLCSDRADELFPGHVEDRDGGGVTPGHVRVGCYVHIHIIDCGYDLMSVYIYQNLPKCTLSRYTASICPLYLNKVVLKKKDYDQPSRNSHPTPSCSIQIINFPLKVRGTLISNSTV